MSRTPAIGSDPVLFYRPDGLLEEISLADVYFDGGIVAWDHAVDPAHQKVPALLTYLAARGVLRPAPKPAAIASVSAMAAKDGPIGNRIEIEIAPSTSGDPTKVDITVTETDVYEKLSLATLPARLGIDTTEGSDAGLLRL